MQSIAVIAERLSSLSYKFAYENGIYLIPTNAISGDIVYQDKDDDSAQSFFKKLEEMTNIPTTAVPSYGEMKDHFEKACENFDSGIYIAASSKLSGMYNLGLKVAQDLKQKGKDIKVFDSFATVSITGMYAYEAAKLSRENKSSDEIMLHLENLKKNKQVVEFGLLEDLKYLEKGGRIGKAKFWLATLLSFMPIISAEDGVLKPVSRARSAKQGIDLMIESIKNHMEKHGFTKLSVMYDYGISKDMAEKEINPLMEKTFKMELISYNQISIVIACHLGPNVTGICVKFS